MPLRELGEHGMKRPHFLLFSPITTCCCTPFINSLCNHSCRETEEWSCLRQCKGRQKQKDHTLKTQHTDRLNYGWLDNECRDYSVSGIHGSTAIGVTVMGLSNEHCANRRQPTVAPELLRCKKAQFWTCIQSCLSPVAQKQQKESFPSSVEASGNCIWKHATQIAIEWSEINWMLQKPTVRSIISKVCKAIVCPAVQVSQVRQCAGNNCSGMLICITLFNHDVTLCVKYLI